MEATLAMSQLYQAEYRHVVSYAYKALGNRFDAEDVAQDAFLALWLSRGAPSTTNIFRSARSRLIDRYRHKALTTEPLDSASALRVGVEDGAVERLSTTEDVNVALAAMSDLERACVLMHIEDGRDYQSIATLLGIPVGTVKSRINHGRKLAVAAVRRKFAI